jgi:hypothetical protein
MSKEDDRAALRKKTQEMLKKNIPTDLSSDDKRFQMMTGMSTTSLRKKWATGSRETSCNSFAGWVAREIGITNSVLSRGVLDISKAEDEVAGCWTWANTSETIYDDTCHPHAGDFYSGPFPGQQFGHVGVVYDFDEIAQTWTLIQGGQGGPKSNMDFIKWKTVKFDGASINGWVDTAWYMIPGYD